MADLEKSHEENFEHVPLQEFTSTEDPYKQSNPEDRLEKHKPPPIDVTEASAVSQTGNNGPKTPQTPGPYSTLERKRAERERKIGHRRVDEQGQVTYKKIETSQICGSIQLGIGYAVGSLASKPERDLLMQDFAMVETTSFPHEGSNITPAHHYSDYKFKVYAPVAFRYFRDLFGIQPDDFLLSVCNEPMRELSNPGASGSVFYLTDDDEFIIKTVQHKEADFLQKLLPGYYMNLNQNPRTLLPKFFGLYCYLCGGKNVRLLVMNNLLPSFIKLHEKYDLKGSTYKRKASKYEKSKESPTYKDLDFMEKNPEGIFLEAETFNALMKTIQRDCRVLESFKIMDYSLLVGIHNLDLASKEKQERIKEKMAAVAAEAAAEARGRGIVDSEGSEGTETDEKPTEFKKPNAKSNLFRSKSINRQRLAAYSTAMESIQAEVDPIDEDDDVPPGGIPARNAKGERLLLFMGIIDILQSYRFKKKLEHSLKAMLTDGDTISVHKPGFYAQRFQDFMAKTVFKKIPSRATAPQGVRSVVINPVTSSIHTTHPKTKPTSEPSPSLRTVVIKQAASKQSVSIMNKSESISVSQINFNTESTNSVTSSVTSSSSGTSGLGSTLRTITWTPPHSVEGSTPTHTEGTPSLTESSESGDVACPTTPLRSISRRSQASSQCSDGGGDAFSENLEMSKTRMGAPRTIGNPLSPIAEDRENAKYKESVCALESENLS